MRETACLLPTKSGCSSIESERNSEMGLHCCQRLPSVQLWAFQSVMPLLQHRDQNGFRDEQRQILTCAHLRPSAEMIERQSWWLIKPLLRIELIRHDAGFSVSVVECI